LIKKYATRCWDVLTSMPLTIILLALLMVLVLLCTFAQINLGTLGAVNTYMRSMIVWWNPQGMSISLPVFPGGALVGLLLTLNLVASTLKRIGLNGRKAGLWIIHAGLVFLFAGEFVTGAYQQDRRMTIEEGQTSNHVDSTREIELAIIDTTDTQSDDVFAIPEGLLSAGSIVNLPGSPLAIKIRQFLSNSEMANRAPTDAPSQATAGIGPMVNVRERGPATSDNEMNIPAAFIEPVAAGRSFGTWLVSTALGAPQSFTHEGRTYALALRPRRDYLPYSITLKKFHHDVYPGTDIPKNFSSLVHVSNPPRGEERDVLISMNQPLRYEGRAFYQASFGKGDTLSIFQVVANPGWLIPYISCVLVTLGLLIHFGVMLMGRRTSGQEA
jgi:ResB-like family